MYKMMESKYMNRLFNFAILYYAKGYHILNTIINIILYIVFFLLNVLLMLDYLKGQEYWFLFLTFSFTIPPAAIITSISLIMARKSSQSDYMKKHKVSSGTKLFEEKNINNGHTGQCLHPARNNNSTSRPVLKRGETIPSPAPKRKKLLLKQRSDAIDLDDVPEINMDDIDPQIKAEGTDDKNPNYDDIEKIVWCSSNGNYRLSVDGKRKIDSFKMNAMLSVDCIDQVELNLNPKVQKWCFILPHFILQPSVGWLVKLFHSFPSELYSLKLFSTECYNLLASFTDFVQHSE